MLRHDQIKRLVRGYTNRQITRDRQVVITETWWSNKQVVLFEDTPGCLDPDEIIQGDHVTLGEVQSWLDSPYQVQVYPTRVKPLGDTTLLRFTSSDVLPKTYWVDARYVSSIYKRCTEITWWYTENRFVCRGPAGTPVAILMEWVPTVEYWEAPWSFASESIDLGTLHWARMLSARLPRGKAGRKWRDVEDNHVRRVGARKHESIEFGSREGDPVYRISLYDGAVYLSKEVNYEDSK